MEPLVQPANSGTDQTKDHGTFGKEHQLLAALGTALSDGHTATVAAHGGGEVHGRDHVHIGQTLLPGQTWGVGDEAFQTVNLAVHLIGTLAQAARLAARRRGWGSRVLQADVAGRFCAAGADFAVSGEHDLGRARMMSRHGMAENLGRLDEGGPTS